MIIRAKLQPQSSQKKKLSIGNSKSRFSTSNNNIQKSFEYKKKDSNLKNICQQNEEVSHIVEKKQLSVPEKQNFHTKLSRSKSRIVQNSKSSNKGLKLLKQMHTDNTSAVAFPISGIGLLINEQKELIPQSRMSNTKRISSLVGPLNSKQLNQIKSREDQTRSSEFPQQSNCQRRRHDQIRKNSYLSLDRDQPQHLGSMWQPIFSCQNKVKSQQTFKTSKFRRFQINSNVLTVLVTPSEKVIKVNVQVQTIQTQKQYFQYLKYKRRKQQFQQQLQNQFLELQTIRNDRQIYKERVQSLISNKKGPQDQRQRRVFNLRQQMARLQGKVQLIIEQKSRSFELYTRKVQNIQDELTQDNQKFKGQFEEYIKLIKVALQKRSQDQFLRVSEGLQETTQVFLNQVIYKIQGHVRKGKPYKQEATKLRQTFDEYNSSIQQFKGLLKNFFNHIKKISQLCYGLYGQVLPDLDARSQLRNSNNEFQMPKCMNCFNSQWKSHMIIQKNILMESVFKVSQQLFK